MNCHALYLTACLEGIIIIFLLAVIVCQGLEMANYKKMKNIRKGPEDRRFSVNEVK